MKLRELIQRVDQSNPQGIDPDEYIQALDLGGGYVNWSDFNKRVQSHYLASWYCTDTWAGLSVCFMDGEPIAVSYQAGRKCDVSVEFVSAEAAKKLRDFLLELMGGEEEAPPLANLDEEMEDAFHVAYGNQLLVKEGIYQGRLAKVVKTYYDHGPGDHKMWSKVDVAVGDEVITIDLQDFDIPYYLEKP